MKPLFSGIRTRPSKEKKQRITKNRQLFNLEQSLRELARRKEEEQSLDKIAEINKKEDMTLENKILRNNVLNKIEFIDPSAKAIFHENITAL